ncbi:Gfo/Idh/MocA family protein [Spirosoma arcticum]
MLKPDTSIALPEKKRPIILIGAGAIVRDAHLPAYQKAGWPVVGIYDPVTQKAEALSTVFTIERVAHSLDDLVRNAPANGVFDVAVPAKALPDVLPILPDGATVLIQKPLGTTLEEARFLADLCRRKGFTAAMNFQKRFIPAILAAKRLIDAGEIGQLHHIEIRMNIWHPWHLWEFLFGIPRMEMLYHSIHYMDLMRYFLGNPVSVYAKTVKHPKMMQLASTRSTIILDYGELIQAFITTNHGHEFGPKYQDAFIKWEGTDGAIRHTMGKNIDFPTGATDTFEVNLLHGERSGEWQSFTLDKTWYPDAFIGSMANLMGYAEGSQATLINSIDSAYQTMRLVEAAYESSERGGIPL